MEMEEQGWWVLVPEKGAPHTRHPPELNSPGIPREQRQVKDQIVASSTVGETGIRGGWLAGTAAGRVAELGVPVLIGICCVESDERVLGRRCPGSGVWGDL